MKQYIYGKNTILEALKGDKSVYTVYVQNNAKDNGIIEQCKRKKIPFKIVDKSEFIKKLGNVSHQGVMAEIEEYRRTERPKTHHPIPLCNSTNRLERKPLLRPYRP